VESNKKELTSVPVEFSEIVKKAYEKGHNEDGITISKLIEELKMDLKNMMIN
jgi:hypothetical protein